MEIDDWAIIDKEGKWIEMVIRWDGNEKEWPLPKGTYAIKLKDLDFSTIKEKPE